MLTIDFAEKRKVFGKSDILLALFLSDDRYHSRCGCVPAVFDALLSFNDYPLPIFFFFFKSSNLLRYTGCCHVFSHLLFY